MPSSMTERLSQQLEKRARLDAEVLQQQRKLAQSAAEQQTMAAKEDALNAERAKLMSLREKLTQQHEAVMAQLKARETEDQAMRATLSDELTARIKDVNVRVEEENAQWAAAVAENQRLKEKIALVEESIANGTTKFEELITTREKEFDDMKTKSAALEEANVALRERAAAAEELVKERLPIHRGARERAEEFTQRFTEVQDKITEANAHFSSAKTTQAKLGQRLKALDAERQTSARALDRVRAELASEMTAQQKLDAQAQALVTATERIIATTKMLQDQLTGGASATAASAAPAEDTASPPAAGE